MIDHRGAAVTPLATGGWASVRDRTMSTRSQAGGVTLALLPFTAIVFACYCAVGLPLATLPLQVHDVLGYGTGTVGLVIGLAPAATLLTRQFAGRLADRRGPRPGVLLGLAAAAASGLCYLAAGRLAGGPALAALLAGRVLLGLGDSLCTTAVAAWAISRVGSQHAGRCMAWIGIAMYGALAAGAPVGVVLDGWAGFTAVGTAVAVAPLAALPLAARDDEPAGRRRSGRAAHDGAAGGILPAMLQHRQRVVDRLGDGPAPEHADNAAHQA